MRRPRPSERRHGFILSVELLFVLPVLLLVVFALIELSLVFAAERKLTEVSGVVARAGALGATDAQMDTVLDTALGTVSWKTFVTKTYTPAVTPPATRNTGETLTVTLAVPASKVSPNLLKVIGIDLTTITLTATTTVIVE